MEIRFIDEKHAADINIPNEPFPIRGRMVITYNGDRWEHTEKLLPSEQIEETTFPDENYNYHEMKDYVFIGAYEGADCIGLAILTPVFNPCLFLYDLKVKCKMRGKGIGKQLIKASYQYAIANGYAGLYTVGQDNNLNACLFYLACGFEIGGLDTKIYENTNQNEKIESFEYEGQKITNFEMESSALAGLAKLMGHKATTVCMVIANRVAQKADTGYKNHIDDLIKLVLDRI